MLKNLFAIAVLTLCPSLLFASSGQAPGYVSAYVRDASRVGAGRMDYMLMDIYDAELFATQGKWQGEDQPMALSLTYLRNLSGAKIADKSIELIEKQARLDPATAEQWRAQMTAIFPDVKKGTNITGVLTPVGETIFYQDGEEAGRIEDPEFGPRFFAIWLSPKTTEPELRAELLGLAN